MILRNVYLTLDKVINNHQIIFVCHSMGGIVVRKFIVERILDIKKQNLSIGLFLVASPSLGSDYANYVNLLSKLVGNAQAKALGFSQENNWLNDLDKEFKNIKESGELNIQGKELIEDKPIIFKKLLLRNRLLSPFLRPSILVIPIKFQALIIHPLPSLKNKEAIQHRLLVEFIKKITPQELSNYRKPNGNTVLHNAGYGNVDLDLDLLVLPYSSYEKSFEQTYVVYPIIDASNENPIVGECIDLSVTLEDQKSIKTSGLVLLPHANPEKIYIIQVNLLCAEISLWDTLMYCMARGTTKPACFTITVPVLNDTNGDNLEREKLLVRTNFYYETRWCGEGQRFLDLRIDETIPPLKVMPKPPEGLWQNLILIEQGAQPPDLLVRILRSKNNNYIWTCLSPT